MEKIKTLTQLSKELGDRPMFIDHADYLLHNNEPGRFGEIQIPGGIGEKWGWRFFEDHHTMIIYVVDLPVQVIHLIMSKEMLNEGDYLEMFLIGRIDGATPASGHTASSPGQTN